MLEGVRAIGGSGAMNGEGAARREAGSATVLMLAVLGVGLVMLTVVLALGGAVLARHRAQAGADLAALAAAGRAWVTGAPDCAVAARVAEADGGRLAACQGLGSGVVEVRVEVRARLGIRGALTGTAEGRARAGPCLAC